MALVYHDHKAGLSPFPAVLLSYLVEEKYEQVPEKVAPRVILAKLGGEYVIPVALAIALQ